MRSKAFTLIELLIVIAIIAILALIAIPNFIEAQMRAKVARCHADMRTIATALESYFVDSNAYPRLRYDNANDHGYSSFGNPMWFESENDLTGVGTIGLTTPIAYLASRPPIDPFQDRVRYYDPSLPNHDYSYYLLNFLGADQHAQYFESEWLAANSAWQPHNIDYLTAPAPMRFNAGRGATCTDPAPNYQNAPIHWANYALISWGPDRDYVTDRRPDGSACMCAVCFINGYGHWRMMEGGLTTLYDPTNGTVSRGMIFRLNGDTLD